MQSGNLDEILEQKMILGQNQGNLKEIWTLIIISISSLILTNALY